MVFVHARKDTVKTAQMLKQKAGDEDELIFFDASSDPQHELRKRDLAKSKNREMKELYQYGFGIHHAGMLRTDRTLTEKLFAEGLIKVSGRLYDPLEYSGTFHDLIFTANRHCKINHRFFAVPLPLRGGSTCQRMLLLSKERRFTTPRREPLWIFRSWM